MVFYKLNLALDKYYVAQPWSRQYGILIISQLYTSPRPDIGIVLAFTLLQGGLKCSIEGETRYLIANVSRTECKPCMDTLCI
jgi:hypothetical protein